MPPTKSPLQLKELAFQTRFAAELLKAYNAFMQTVPQIKAAVAEARALANEARTQLARIDKLPKGEKGDSVRGPQGPQGKQGKDGLTPIKGKDYFTDAEIREIAQIASTFVLTPEDGKDAIVDYDAIVKRTIEALKEEEFFGGEFEKMRGEISSYRHQLAGKIYGKNTWARGGGSSSSANDGIAFEIPSGVVDDSNTTFTVANDPEYIIVNGAQYFVGTGTFLSYAAPTITLSSPVGEGGFIRSAYVP